jgi:hypothetical protein
VDGSNGADGSDGGSCRGDGEAASSPAYTYKTLSTGQYVLREHVFKSKAHHDPAQRSASVNEVALQVAETGNGRRAAVAVALPLHVVGAAGGCYCRLNNKHCGSAARLDGECKWCTLPVHAACVSADVQSGQIVCDQCLKWRRASHTTRGKLQQGTHPSWALPG